MKKTMIIFCLAILAVLPAIAQAHLQSGLIQKYVSLFPQPAENEFASAEAVITYYFEALKKNDTDGMMKCFPLRERFLRLTTRDYLEYMQAFHLRVDAVDGFDLHNFMLVMSGFHSTVLSTIFHLVPSDDGNSFDRPQALFPGSDGYEEKIISIMNALKLDPLAGLRNLRITEEKKGPMQDSLLAATGFVQMKAFLVTVETPVNGGIDRKFYINCGKIGSNWRIAYIKEW